MNITTQVNTIRTFFQRQTGVALAIAALSLTTACVTGGGQQFNGIATPVADKGDVYFYRTSAFAAGGASFPVSLNNEEIDPLVNASFIYLRLAPGSHVLAVKPGPLTVNSELAIEVKAGTTNFYRYEFPTGILFNLFLIGSGIEPKDQATALVEMKELRAVK